MYLGHASVEDFRGVTRGLRLGASPFASSEISGWMGLGIGIGITESVW